MKEKKCACALDGVSRRAVIEISRLMARGTPALLAVTGSHTAHRNGLAALLRQNFDLEVLRGGLPGNVSEELQSPRAVRRQITAAGRAVCIVEERDALPPELLSLCDLIVDTDTGQIARTG